MDLLEFSNICHNRDISELDFKSSFTKFYNYYNKLAQDVLKDLSFTDNELAEYIFLDEINEDQDELYFTNMFYSSLMTLKRINTYIERGKMNYVRDVKAINFKNFLLTFCYDVYNIVLFAERIRGNTIKFNMGSRPNLTISEIFENSSIILNIDHFTTTDISYRDFFSNNNVSNEITH